MARRQRARILQVNQAVRTCLLEVDFLKKTTSHIEGSDAIRKAWPYNLCPEGNVSKVLKPQAHLRCM